MKRVELAWLKVERGSGEIVEGVADRDVAGLVRSSALTEVIGTVDSVRTTDAGAGDDDRLLGGSPPGPFVFDSPELVAIVVRGPLACSGSQVPTGLKPRRVYPTGRLPPPRTEDRMNGLLMVGPLEYFVEFPKDW